MNSYGWLTGWKEIGTFCGVCGRTAIRYAELGMPVHYAPTGTPHALPWQLTAWLMEITQVRRERRERRLKAGI